MVHAAWSNALQAEAQYKAQSCASPEACYLAPAYTAVIKSAANAADDLKHGWLLWDNTTLPNIPQALIDNFKLRCSASVAIDPASITLALPVLPASTTEYDESLSLSGNARKEACGLVAMTDVAVDDEGRGLVVIQLWAAQTPNPFQYAVLLQRNGDTWVVMATQDTHFLLMPGT